MSLRRLTARLEKAQSTPIDEPLLDLGLSNSPPGSVPATPLSISDLTATIRDLLEGQLGEIWVTGEISNYRNPGSGHLYFTLKDATATLSAVMFRSEAVRIRFPLVDGKAVLARGRVTVYEARGQYQLQVLELRAQGQGALQQRFDELKRKLQDEGLFDLARKRPLPIFPETVGIITSLQGAVLQDIRQVLLRRAPGIRLLLRGVRVQGEGAAVEVAEALRAFAAERQVDLILLARGGGSLEDLWPFNEEIVARALAASPIPTVSAIGHETDFTIADFVADFRAATPSVAAESISRDWSEWREELTGFQRRLNRSVTHVVQTYRREVARVAESYLLREPQRRVQQWNQRVDDLSENLHAGSTQRLAQIRQHWEMLRLRLKAHAPQRELMRHGTELAHLHCRLVQRHPLKKIQALRDALAHLAARLRSLGPQAILDRGYALMLDKEGRPIRRAELEQEGKIARVLVAQGAFQVTIKRAEPEITLSDIRISTLVPTQLSSQKRVGKKKS